MFSKECRHKFQARYDEIPPQSIGGFEGNLHQLESVIEKFTKRIYVKDICIKCGKTINRQEM